MAFTWTYPDPLDPNKPSLIGKHLRNEIGSFAIYFKELQDAVDELREKIGQVAYTWPSEVPVGETLEHDHYTILITVINQLVNDYDTSVVDILGRDWTELEWVTDVYPSVETKLQRLGGWQLIQDFRDVLDALISGEFERWTSSARFELSTPVITDSSSSYLTEDYNADLGEWMLRVGTGASTPFVEGAGDHYVRSGIKNEENQRFFFEAQSTKWTRQISYLSPYYSDEIIEHDVQNYLGAFGRVISENCIIDSTHQNFQCKYINKIHEISSLIYDSSPYCSVPYTTIKLYFQDIDDSSYEPSFAIVISDITYFRQTYGSISEGSIYDEFYRLFYKSEYSADYGYYVLRFNYNWTFYDINTTQIFFNIYNSLKDDSHERFRLKAMVVDSQVGCVRVQAPLHPWYEAGSSAVLSYELDDIGFTDEPGFSED